jgi:hypothetical protein
MTPPNPVPEETSPSFPDPVAAQAALPPAPTYRWYHRAGGVLFVVFCLEVGFFLMIFPWTGGWDKALSFVARMRPYFDNLYVRGAISGIGIVNLYISLSEMFRLRRFAKR